MASNDKELVVSYLTLRQMIGWIGLTMPLAVRLGAYVFEHISATDSISAYYYTGMRDVFVSTLVLVGILLACYRSPSVMDNAIAVLAGLSSIGIGLFPMSPVFAAQVLHDYPGMGANECYVNRGILGYHHLFVIAFFALTFVMVTFRFVAFTPGTPTKQKLKRNVIYRVCGALMLLSFIAIGVLAAKKKSGSIFWPETVAVVAFGVAWLVKGQTVLKDPA